MPAGISKYFEEKPYDQNIKKIVGFFQNSSPFIFQMNFRMMLTAMCGFHLSAPSHFFIVNFPNISVWQIKNHNILCGQVAVRSWQ